MNLLDNQRIDYAPELLIPESWQKQFPPESLYTYNPAIHHHQGRNYLALRVTSAGYQLDQVVTCLLDEQLNVIPGSAKATFHFDNPHIFTSDPRLFTYQNRLWMVNGDECLPNLLYISELDADTREVRGKSRPVILNNRQLLEKNWMLFEHDQHLFAIYTISPHVVLQLDTSQPHQIMCHKIGQFEWNDRGFSQQNGDWRGGNTPVLVDGVYYVFTHSAMLKTKFASRLTARMRRWIKTIKSRRNPSQELIADGDVRSMQKRAYEWNVLKNPTLTRLQRDLVFRYYVVGFYAFEGAPPFQPRLFSPQPLFTPDDEPSLAREPLELFKPRVVFPAGAIYNNGQWAVSYGLNEDRCAIRFYNHQTLLARSLPAEIR